MAMEGVAWLKALEIDWHGDHGHRIARLTTWRQVASVPVIDLIV